MEFNDNKPIYLQIADQIMDEVFQRSFVPESRLLSVRDYASKAGVNPNTVMRAYTWLQEEGIIDNKRGIGYFYQPKAKDIVKRKRIHEFQSIELHRVVKKMIMLGLGPDSFDFVYQQYWDKHLRSEL